MTRQLHRFCLALLALIALAAPASALSLSAPAAGSILRGGSPTTIEWNAASLPPHVEEWEAFLSIDGGRYYAFRITPHLDVAHRRFTWQVPNVDTRDARVLVRFGDEKRETVVELPESFSIVRTATRETLPSIVDRRTEPARPGDPDVVAAVEGNRDGSALRVTYTRGRDARHIEDGTTAIASSSPPFLTSVFFSVPPTTGTAALLPAPRDPGSPGLRATSSREILLLCRRLNI